MLTRAVRWAQAPMAQPIDAPQWGLRYASHLGFRAVNSPLFRHSLQSADPGQHVRLAAALGFAGVQYAWALSGTPAELDSFVRASAETGIVGSCVVFAPHSEFARPLWGSSSPAAVTEIKGRIHNACTVARSIGSETVAIVATRDSSVSAERQRSAMVSNLRVAGEVAASYAVTLVIETMRTVPDMLLRSYGELYEVVREVSHPSVKLLFDTYHVCSLEGLERVQSGFVEWYDQIGLIQLADYPDKCEPGAGIINFPCLLEYALRHGYSGMVELEHLWSDESAAGEIKGLERLREIDDSSKRLASESPK